MSKWSTKTESDYKLSQQSAEAVVREIIDFYGINIDIMDPDTRSNMENTFEKMTEFARLGMLEIASESPFVIRQNVIGTDGTVLSSINYGELQGKHKSEMGKVARDDSYGRSYMLLGSLCGLGDSAIRELKGKNLSLAECLGMVFLLV